VSHPHRTGYLFAYFTGEDTADGEQIRYALSRGDDPLHWRELNGGRPVVTSTIGERGLRDPFLIRSLLGQHARIRGAARRGHGTSARRSSW